MFIELKNDKIIVNIDAIDYIDKRSNGDVNIILRSGNVLETSQKYEELIDMIYMAGAL